MAREILVDIPLAQAQPLAWSASGSTVFVSITGLASGEARPGDHLSLGAQMSDLSPITSRKWGATPGGTEYGTGASPTDYVTGSGSSLYLEVISGGQIHSASAPIRHAAPQFTGSLFGQAFTKNTGVQIYDVSPAVTFAGTANYSLIAPATGITIASATGVVSHDTDTAAHLTAQAITVRVADADDTSRYDEATYTLTIQPNFVFTSAGPQGSNGDVPLGYTITADATVDFYVSTSATPPSQPDFTTGTGAADTFSAACTTGGLPINAAVASTLDGTYYIHARVAVNQEIDTSTAVVIDTTAPTVTYSPLDGATGVGATDNLVMTFSEGMKRQGTVTLKNVGGATIETFDLSSSPRVTWSTVSETDDRVTIDPTTDFTASASLAVQYSGLEDTTGNALPNVADDTTWNFDVAAAGLTVTANDADTVDTTSRTGWTLYKWTATGAGSITFSGTGTVEALLVAGGGGGGIGSNGGAGGGGAGGVVENLTKSVVNETLTISVGAGGAGGTNTTNPANGGNTTVTGETTAVGGGSGASEWLDAGNGGSGGGAKRFRTTPGTGTTGQGFAGGNVGAFAADENPGGGGGAGVAGQDGALPSNFDAGAGGIGVQSSITGTVTYYGGGGGGGNTDNGTWIPGTGGNGGGGAGGLSGIDGTANTGGGGGGGYRFADDTARTGGDGGSGLVIIAVQN